MKIKTLFMIVAGIIIVNHFKKKGTAKKKGRSILSGLIDEVKKPLRQTASNVPAPSTGVA